MDKNTFLKFNNQLDKSRTVNQEELYRQAFKDGISFYLKLKSSNHLETFSFKETCEVYRFNFGATQQMDYDRGLFSSGFGCDYTTANSYPFCELLSKEDYESVLSNASWCSVANTAKNDIFNIRAALNYNGKTLIYYLTVLNDEEMNNISPEHNENYRYCINWIKDEENENEASVIVIPINISPYILDKAKNSIKTDYIFEVKQPFFTKMNKDKKLQFHFKISNDYTL